MPRERAQRAMLQAASKPPTAPGFTTTAATPLFPRTSGREAGPPCSHVRIHVSLGDGPSSPVQKSSKCQRFLPLLMHMNCATLPCQGLLLRRL